MTEDTTTRVPRQSSMQAADEFSEQLLEAIGSALIVRGSDGIIVWNAGAERLFGVSAVDALGSTFAELGLAPLDDVRAALELADATTTTVSRELSLHGPDDRRVSVLAHASRLDSGGGAVFVISDLSYRVQLDERLEATRAQAELLLQHAADIVLVIDLTGTISFINDAITDRAQYSRGELIGTSAFELVHPDDQAATRDALHEVAAGHDGCALTFRLRTKSGEHLWVEGRAANLLHERSIRGVLVTLHDITHRVELEAELSHRATHDPLTGLPNRALFADRLQHHADHASRRGLLVAVMFWDVDDFKRINDTAGHPVGDSVLVEAAARASSIVRAEDTVARIGGDEFVLCAELDDRVQVEALANRLREALRIDVTLPDGQRTNVTASIGVAFGAGVPPGELQSEADRAMYNSKQERGGAVTLRHVARAEVLASSREHLA